MRHCISGPYVGMKSPGRASGNAAYPHSISCAICPWVSAGQYVGPATVADWNPIGHLNCCWALTVWTYCKSAQTCKTLATGLVPEGCCAVIRLILSHSCSKTICSKLKVCHRYGFSSLLVLFSTVHKSEREKSCVSLVWAAMGRPPLRTLFLDGRYLSVLDGLRKT